MINQINMATAHRQINNNNNNRKYPLDNNNNNEKKESFKMFDKNIFKENVHNHRR